MKIKCEYCGSFISDTDEKCEFCGAVNSHLIRKGTGIPETIEQLIDFAKQHNLPLDKMHVHLGENFKGPQAIGIYQDEETGNFIVYKNKTDGSRAVRYEGKDEAYAVNEIYQKMKSDMNNHRVKGPAPSRGPSGKKKSGGLVSLLVWIMIAIVILVILFGGRRSSSSSSPSHTTDSGYVRDYDYDDSGSSWLDSWSDSDDNDDSSWWNSNNDSYSWSNDNWDSSNWNWNSSNSWNSGGSNWNSNW